MSAPTTIGVGVIGLGFMGRTHLAAYEAALRSGHPCSVRAVCDRAPEQTAPAGNLAVATAAPPADCWRTTDVDELLARPDVDLVSVCTPTPTHVEIAGRALRAGKHVLVEKPVALTAADCAALARIARESGRVCMPAMCMRFWPGWEWLLQVVAEQRYGPVRSAVFRRLGARPTWSAFYADARSTGGALYDLHIHDADFALAAFGPPDAVTASGDLDHLTALYHYADGPRHVVLEGGWDHARGWPFRMAYTVVFEAATADFDSTRREALLLVENGSVTPHPLPPGDGYEGEVRHLLTTLARGAAEPAVTLDDATRVLELLATYSSSSPYQDGCSLGAEVKRRAR